MIRLRQILIIVGTLLVSLAGFADEDELLGNNNAAHTKYEGNICSISVTEQQDPNYSIAGSDGYWLIDDKFQITVTYSQEPKSTDAVYLVMTNELTQRVLERAFLFSSSTATEKTYSMTNTTQGAFWQHPTKGKTYTITFYKTRTGDAGRFIYSDEMKSCKVTYAIESTISASVGAAKWGTFVAPFDVDFTKPSMKVFKSNGLKTEQDNTYQEIENTFLNLVLVDNKHVPAKTPVLLYSETPCSETFKYIHAATDSTVVTDDELLVGVLADNYTIPASTNNKKNFILQKQGDNVGFYVVSSDKTATQYRVYLQTTSAAANIRLPKIEGPAAAINTVPDTGEKEVVAIYSLSGTVLPTLQKGTNIVKYSDGSTAKIVR